MSARTWTITRARQLQLRPSGLQFVAIAAVVSLLYLFHVFVVPQILRFRFRFDLSPYDLGFYGFGPSRNYASSDLESPVLEISEWGSGCDPRYTFFAPRGDSVAHPGPMILDAQGILVWAQESRDTTQDFKVQRYQGVDYLTYWEGGETEGRGYGSWYMLDSTYTQQHVVTPFGPFGGDLHEFNITPEGTALITIYDPTPADLRPIGGPELGWIHDCLFQEIDIATGELLFEWRASNHFAINNTYHVLEGAAGKTRISAFDFFHINSVDRDDEGNYIISSRHLHMVACIDQRTGNIKWALGGKLNEFEDLSNGLATNFAWQHDARWRTNNTITLFDNGAHGYSDPDHQSRGLAIQLDIPNRTAVLLVEYFHPQRMKSVSQGNVQVLDETGRLLVDWGHSAAFSEFTSDGELLCNVHFGASAFFSFGRVVSYRAFKGVWVGYPQTPPDAEILGDSIFVSWNGATEVVSWRLETWNSDSLHENATFSFVDEYSKTGFETEILIPEDIDGPLFRLAALDAQGTVLGFTDLLQRQEGGSNFDELLNLHYWIVGIAFITSAGGLLAVLYRCFGCRYARRCQARWRRGEYQLVPFHDTDSDQSTA